MFCAAILKMQTLVKSTQLCSITTVETVVSKLHKQVDQWPKFKDQERHDGKKYSFHKPAKHREGMGKTHLWWEFQSAGGTAETTTTLLLGKDFGLLNSFSRKSPFPKSEEIGLS